MSSTCGLQLRINEWMTQSLISNSANNSFWKWSGRQNPSFSSISFRMSNQYFIRKISQWNLKLYQSQIKNQNNHPLKRGNSVCEGQHPIYTGFQAKPHSCVWQCLAGRLSGEGGGDWGCQLAPPPETEETDSFPPVVISKRTLTNQELERLSITSDRILRNWGIFPLHSRKRPQPFSSAADT